MVSRQVKRRAPLLETVAVALLVGVLSTACGNKENESASAASKTVDVSEAFSDPVAAKVAEAAAKGDGPRVRDLIKGGANANAAGNQGVSLLQWAMLNKNKAGFEALLDAGADPARTDAAGDAAMHYAAKADDPAYLDILLAHHADPNVQNALNWTTPLMSALMGERKEQFRKLLAAGANPNLADRLGNTSLHVAAKINETQLALDLLQAGAEPATKNKQGQTFQRYLAMTPAAILSAEARAQRENIMAWLREHNVPLEDAAASHR